MIEIVHFNLIISNVSFFNEILSLLSDIQAQSVVFILPDRLYFVIKFCTTSKYSGSVVCGQEQKQARFEKSVTLPAFSHLWERNVQLSGIWYSELVLAQKLFQQEQINF